MTDLAAARRLELTAQGKVEPRFLDAMGHMNVAWYVYWFDRGVWSYFERHGLDAAYLEREQRGMFALEENVRYLSELRQDDTLDVHTGVLELKPKTVRLQQYIVDLKREKVAAAREVVAAHIDLTSRRSAAFSAEVSALLAAEQLDSSRVGLSETTARAFAQAWVNAWNRGDVEAVLAHYAEDAVFVSPKAAHFVGHARVEGKAALRVYWQTALRHVEQLHFTLDHATFSPRTATLTVVYESARAGQPSTRAAEIMQFRGSHIVRGEAFYGALVPNSGGTP